MYNLSKKSMIRSIILNLIREKAPISRTEIRNIIDQRMATIIEIVKELIDEGIVAESGMVENTEIRKKKLLCLDERTYRVIGAEIRADSVRAAAIDLRGNLTDRSVEDISRKMSRDELLKKLYSVIDKQVSSLDKKALIGIGIANSGILDKEKKNVLFSSQFDNWRNIPLSELVYERYMLPVYIDDSAALNLLAEKRYGKAAECEDAIYMQMGESFGMSMISGGRIIRGASGMAGEIGHTAVDPRGELCTCGNYGCLQTAASMQTIVRKVRTLIGMGAYSELSECYSADTEKIEFELISKAAARGDKICSGVLEEAAGFIGIALSNTVNLLNPAMIIFSGPMAAEGIGITETVKRVISANALQLARNEITYEKAAFEDDGGEKGAAAMVIDAFFDKDN